MWGLLSQAVSINISIIWILIVLTPTYLLVSAILCKMLLFSFQVLKDKPYPYVGNVSWILPFKTQEDIKPTNILLIANLMGVLSLTFIIITAFQYYTEKQTIKMQKSFKKCSDHQNQQQKKKEQ